MQQLRPLAVLVNRAKSQVEKVEDAEVAFVNTGVRPTLVLGSFWERCMCQGETVDAIHYWQKELSKTNMEIQTQQKQHLDQVRRSLVCVRATL